MCIRDRDENGHLTSVTETYKIQPFPDGTIRDTEKDPGGVILDPESLVSMNSVSYTHLDVYKRQCMITA